MIAFHGEPALKEAAIARMREHREQDRLVRGMYWGLMALRRPSDKTGRYGGCAIGCLVAEAIGFGDETRPRQGVKDLLYAYEALFGIPAKLAVAEEIIFEGLLSDEVAYQWPEEFLEAIPVGADLTTLDLTWLDESDVRKSIIDIERERLLAQLRALPPIIEPPEHPVIGAIRELMLSRGA